MELDFTQIYKRTPTVELLQILEQPKLYQQAAIDAAREELLERGIAPDEVESVRQKLEQEAAVKARRAYTREVRTKAVFDFLGPVSRPREAVTPVKWLRIFLLVVAIEYVWSLVMVVRGIIVTIQINDYRIGAFDAIYLAGQLCYPPLVFYLLLRRRCWGWILLFGECIFIGLTQISQTDAFIAYQSATGADASRFLLPILIRVAFAAFLWRQDISGFFSIAKKTKRMALKWSIAISALFVVTLRLVYG
jgi:hypothetical protein